MTHEQGIIRRLKHPLVGGRDDMERLLDREYLVTNGLGGFSSGSISGYSSRRYHGLLVSAQPAPLGRMVMLSDLREEIRLADDTLIQFGAHDPLELSDAIPTAEYLEEFRLENGLPVWRYVIGRTVLERKILMPALQNTVYITYRLLEPGTLERIRIWPYMHFRRMESAVDQPLPENYAVTAIGKRYEIRSDQDLPTLRMYFDNGLVPLVLDEGHQKSVFYRTEQCRGYDCQGLLWNPGYFRLDFSDYDAVTFVASTESWEAVLALDPERAARAEDVRVRRLLALAGPGARTGIGPELVRAADQFVVTPVTRMEDKIRANAAGDEVRTVIAGYHWFTDWGRDTMIGLEGLTLATGRTREAGYILREFAIHIRDGLIPNMFPEGSLAGLYNTADATLWFFHALDRYLSATGDILTLRMLLPALRDIIDRHEQGTRFGIGLDPQDGLLTQGAEGYQLTWMDAKVEGWVVTPRRGKAVEINALWYNALRLMERWAGADGGAEAAAPYGRMADRTREAFNNRFWNASAGCLYDVVDAEGGGDDDAIRPNQIFSVSLPHPVLSRERWESVVEVVRRELLTPVGLRSLARGHKDYKPQYSGDLRNRDAAYHQGTVWGWLIGPFIDAWLKLHPDDLQGARSFLEGFVDHLNEGCVGSISEIFDARAPYTPRGCVAQAWSVAEVLRCWILTDPESGI